MILATFVAEHGHIVSQATNHATTDRHSSSTVDALLHLRAQELCQTIGTSTVKRVVVQRHEQLLLYCLSQGAQAFICACTDRPDRAFAAFGFLSDVCARWGSKTERLAFESVLRAQMVHYSAAQIEGASLLLPPLLPCYAPC